MGLIDFILDIVCLLLWLGWLSIGFDFSAKAPAASLAGTLRNAGQMRPKRWLYFTSLWFLLFIRALAMWQICPTLHLNPRLYLGITNLAFRSDHFLAMLLFPLLSFATILADFYFWMLLLSAANSSIPDNDPFQRMVRSCVSWVERWPAFLKLLLPFVLATLAWLAVQPMLAWLQILPPIKAPLQLFEQAALIGASAYLAWKYLVVGILFLHLLNSYVYFGNHSAWQFINTTAKNILSPIRWIPLSAGRVDFRPAIAIALVFLLAEGFAQLPARYYRLLPF